MMWHLKQAIVLSLILTVFCGFFSTVSGSASLELDVSLSVNEGDDFEVCISLNPPATENTDVTVATSVATAIALDFTTLDEVITFTQGETRRCATSKISIMNDNIVESVENFMVRISSNDIPIDALSSLGTTVSIGDRSRITIAFTASEYTAPNEVDSFSEVCATITDGEVDREVSFSITAVAGGNAVQFEDFNVITVISPTFSPVPANNNPCAQISLEDDMLVEEDEYFYVQLSGGYEAINVPAYSIAIVIITDDDGATVQLAQSLLIISEGDSGINTTASLCFTLTNVMNGLRRDVDIYLSTQDRIALASDNDYYLFQNEVLSIPSTTSVGGQVCRSVIFIGDYVRESNELFQVAISAVDSNDMVPSVFRITIADDGDVKVACPGLSAPLNGEVNVDDINNVEGSTATYSCGGETYILIGNTMRTCQNTGQLVGEWSGSDPVCQLIDCGPPPEPANSMIQVATTTLGSTAVYSCNTGFQLSTRTFPVTRECLSTGAWSGTTPNCSSNDGTSLNITLIISVTVSVVVLFVIIPALVVIIMVSCKLKCCLKKSTTSIQMRPNAVYGVIVTTPNEMYGVSTDGIETTPNEVYGVSTDGIETKPNEVYGVMISTDGIETKPNEVYGVSTDGIEMTPNEVYGVSLQSRLQ